MATLILVMWVEKILALDKYIFFQATRCSFTGRLDSDPDSTVYVSGCWLEKENMDISVMSKKVSDMKTRPSVLVMSNPLRYAFQKKNKKPKNGKILEFFHMGGPPHPSTKYMNFCQIYHFFWSLLVIL